MDRLPELSETARALRESRVFRNKTLIHPVAGIFDAGGRMLGRGLAMIVDTLNPACIAIGSLYGRCRDLLEKPMRAALAAEALPQSLAVCRIVPAGLGEKVGDYAALAVVAQGMEQPRGGAGSP